VKIHPLRFFLLLGFISCFFRANAVRNADSLRAVTKDESFDPDERLIAFRDYLLATFYDNTSDAYPELQEYLALAKQNNHAIRTAHAYHCLNFYYRNEQQFDSARSVANLEYEVAKKGGSNYYVANAIVDIGLVYEDQGLFAEAIAQYRMALDSSIKFKEHVIEARSRINIGISQKKQGNYIEALKELQLALNLCKDNGTTGFIASTLLNLGDVNSLIGADEKAKQYFKEALEWSSKKQNSNTKRLALRSYANLKIRQGKLEDAGNLLSNLLESSLESGLIAQIGIANYKLAELARLQGQLDSAQYCIQVALTIFEKGKLDLEKAESFAIAAKIDLDRGQIQQALKHALQTDSINDKIKSEDIELVHSHTLYKIYSALGDYKNALKFKELYELYKEGRTNQNVTREVVRLQLENDFEREQRRIELLKQKELQKQQLYSFIFLIGIFIALLIAVIAIRFSIINKRKNQKLSDQKRELEKRDGERNILLKEIHHRVKNNLQIICSLLEIQSLNSANEEISAVLLEGQNRVKSMSLIHQSLYQAEDMGSINFDNYAKNLVQNLIQSYQMQQLKVSYKLIETKLDIDTAIPLGLILNELVSNAMKHAYKNVEQPELSIELAQLAEGEFNLSVNDNGVGINSAIPIKEIQSTGMQLIFGLAKQLFGSITYKVENGSRFQVNFKDTLLRNKLS
jgi:two-component sensor histidine kinase